MRRKQHIIRQRGKTGKGLVNTLINNLPFEGHIKVYSYFGPGTKLEKRLARGDKGINKLDEACEVHDIDYVNSEKLSDRHIADKILEEAGSQQLKASNASIGEKMAALGVQGVMNLKRKLGMGLKKNIKGNRVRKGGALNNGQKQKHRGKRNKRKERIIPRMKKEGFLPFLLPLLDALGAVEDGAAGIAKAVNDANTNRKLLEEQKRHNLRNSTFSGGIHKGYASKKN